MLRVHSLLDAGGYPNSSLICEKVGCSLKTVRRDIEFMRERLKLPIGYDERRYGFYYTEKVKQFPTVKLTTGELISLCFVRQWIEAHRGSPFEAHLRSAFEKITHSMDEEVSFRWDELASTFSFRTNGREVTANIEVRLQLTENIADCEEVTFLYSKLHTKGCERRRVEPVHVICMEDFWYLLAFDLVRDEYRIFAISRITELEKTGRTFKKDKRFDPKEFLADSIGIYRGERPERILLRAHGIAARLLAERYWHSSQKVKEVPGTDGDEVEVTLKVAGTPELERWIFSWAGEARVIEPTSLRDRIRAKARKMARET